MLPVIALVGRPNVGKSTFFNRLTRSRDAIVADFPGLTRDRQYGQGRVGPGPYIVVDTGGFEPVRTEGIVQAMAGQAGQARQWRCRRGRQISAALARRGRTDPLSCRGVDFCNASHVVILVGRVVRLTVYVTRYTSDFPWFHAVLVPRARKVNHTFDGMRSAP